LDEDTDPEEFTLGKKRKVRLSDIDRAGNLEAYKKDLRQDIESLDSLLSNLRRFEESVRREIETKNNHKSRDDKLEVLISKINEKRESGKNRNNQKVLIFTVFKDTAFYLFDQLKGRGFVRLAAVSGDEAKTDDSAQSHKKFEPIPERFAPHTKLFGEKEWKAFEVPENLSQAEVYERWKTWVSERHPHIREQLERPIYILIATDCLSEGQNLQDCDFVVNYDIHWNPVRVIQRMGRIDRLGSVNSTIYGLNFWPSDSINAYLNLQNRIENRMMVMKLAGSEVDKHFTDNLRERIEDALERSQKARMMRQIQASWDDIEVSGQGLGFEDFSLESFRQDMNAELNLSRDKYDKMPGGIYTGFEKDADICPKDGVVALLGYPARPSGITDFAYTSYDLIYIDRNGDDVLLNQKEVLDALAKHKERDRFVPEAVDRGEEFAIKPLSAALKSWLKRQAAEEVTDEQGNIKTRMGKSAKDVLRKLKSGDVSAVKRIKENTTVEDKFRPDNCDLIVWFLVR